MTLIFRPQKTQYMDFPCHLKPKEDINHAVCASECNCKHDYEFDDYDTRILPWPHIGPGSPPCARIGRLACAQQKRCVLNLPRINLSVLRVCRQMYLEGAQVLYTNTTFCFDLPRPLMDFCSLMQQCFRKCKSPSGHPGFSQDTEQRTGP